MADLRSTVLIKEYDKVIVWYAILFIIKFVDEPLPTRQPLCQKLKDKLAVFGTIKQVTNVSSIHQRETIDYFVDT